jgi:hypothetical protein
MKRFLRSFFLLGLLQLLPVRGGIAAPADEAQQWEWNDVPRIVAIGDVHGAYNNLVALLKNAGLIDEKRNWIGGKTHLVQLGDVVDRGPESRRRRRKRAARFTCSSAITRR